MNINKNELTQWQLFFLIVQTQIGISILSLPNTVFKNAKWDGWISVLIAGIGIQIIITVIWMLLKNKNKMESIFSKQTLIFGKKIGSFFNLLYILFFIMIFSFVLVLYSEIIKTWILIYTPHWLIVLTLLIPIVYLVRAGLQPLARFYVLTIPIIILIIISIAISYKRVNIFYILPIGYNGLQNILIASKDCIIAMLGLEVIMVGYTHTKIAPKKAYFMSSLANIVVTIIYSFTVFTCSIYFSPEEINIVPHPVLYMTKGFTSPIIERVDLIFVTLWVLLVITTASSYLYMASFGLKYTFKKVNFKAIVIVVGFLSFFLTFIPREQYLLIKDIGKVISFVSFGFLFFLPVFLLILSIFIKRKGEKNETTT
ncbi:MULTISPECIES: GerAB/ArcD/ProY family transporter [Bacillus]|uniref:GerAB/ArcD/ProY family transporter n=1 Tax=Bacillus TaxID=1386 RepID=UPI0012FED033|nr:MULTISPECIES: GerAB/ArcD/ProY family transporter [Bacillus]